MTLTLDTLSMQSWLVLDAIAKSDHPLSSADLPAALPPDFTGSLHAHELEASLGSLHLRSLLRETDTEEGTYYESTEAGNQALAEFWTSIDRDPSGA